jgi:hypothetical protein
MGELNRREMLKGLMVAGAAGAGAGLAGCASSAGRSRLLSQRDPGRIRRENQREGTDDWLSRKTQVDPATKYRCPWIEGYCSRTSLRAGDSVTEGVDL